VTEVNEAVSETPELINEDPYDAGWLIKVKLSDASETEKLLDAKAYQELLKQGD
jgi:glycine cleavage system H protein